jgi:hypothetical protein
MNPAVPATVRALARSSELTAFCAALEDFLETGVGGEELPARAAALATEARSLDLPPEHILYALRVARCNVGHSVIDTERERAVGRRYASAIALLLRHYFGVSEEEIESVGDVARAQSAIERDFRAEVAVRVVVDPRSGTQWRVRLVREGYSWDPEIRMRRRDWLLCESGTERRFISPAPADWLEWGEGHLLAAVRAAPADHRRP